MRPGSWVCAFCELFQSAGSALLRTDLGEHEQRLGLIANAAAIQEPSDAGVTLYGLSRVCKGLIKLVAVLRAQGC